MWRPSSRPVRIGEDAPQPIADRGHLRQMQKRKLLRGDANLGVLPLPNEFIGPLHNTFFQLFITFLPQFLLTVRPSADRFDTELTKFLVHRLHRVVRISVEHRPVVRHY